VFNHLHEHNVPVTHITPSKPKCFPDTNYNLINAYNTGVMLSRGEVVVILNDYIWLPPDALKRCYYDYLRYGDRTVVTNVAHNLQYKPYEKRGDITCWEEPWNTTPTGAADWIPRSLELFYTTIPWKLLTETNGFPECYDAQKANQVESFRRSIEEVDGRIVVDNRNICYHVMHRYWAGKDGEWYQSWRPGHDGMVKVRDNCFNLKEHHRGRLL
jgi:glycosyltransferase involved in cell wall biosynthesis